MTFGEKLKAARNEKGMTQRQLSEKMNISQQAVAKFERLIIPPKKETVEKIAAALSMAPADLFPFAYKEKDGTETHSVEYYQYLFNSGNFKASDAFDLWLIFCEMEYKEISEQNGRLYIIEEGFDRDYFFITNKQYKELRTQTLKYLKDKLITFNYENVRDPEIKKQIEEAKKKVEGD